VFIAAAYHLDPDWHDLAAGFQPHWEGSSLYAYFVVGVIAAALVPYEVHFYSSGAVEEGWTPQEDLGVNRANAILGFGLGGILSVAIIATSAQVFNGIAVEPTSLGTTALSAERSFGETGLLLALGGMLFAIGGAAIEVALAGAYNMAQFAGWEWGKYRTPGRAPRFSLSWMIFIALAFLVVVTGVDPVELTEYAVVLSVVALPFTYLPVVLIARDRTYMGEHANGPVSAFLGWLFLVVIVVLAVAAIPLLLVTNGGGG
jgi:manganese transport protein